MCNIAKERIRISRLLHDAANIFEENAEQSESELVGICLTILHAYYAGLCPDEALEERAHSFATWFILRQGRVRGPGSNRLAA